MFCTVYSEKVFVKFKFHFILSHLFVWPKRLVTVYSVSVVLAFDIYVQFPFNMVFCQKDCSLDRLLNSGYWKSTGPWWDNKLHPITTASGWGKNPLIDLNCCTFNCYFFHLLNLKLSLIKVYWILQFLSMKLEAVNTRMTPGLEVFPSKDVSPYYM